VSISLSNASNASSGAAQLTKFLSAIWEGVCSLRVLLAGVLSEPPQPLAMTPTASKIRMAFTFHLRSAIMPSPLVERQRLSFLNFDYLTAQLYS
jgi:hypothetical protein